MPLSLSLRTPGARKSAGQPRLPSFPGGSRADRSSSISRSTHRSTLRPNPNVASDQNMTSPLPRIRGNPQSHFSDSLSAQLPVSPSGAFMQSKDASSSWQSSAVVDHASDTHKLNSFTTQARSFEHLERKTTTDSGLRACRNEPENDAVGSKRVLGPLLRSHTEQNLSARTLTSPPRKLVRKSSRHRLAKDEESGQVSFSTVYQSHNAPMQSQRIITSYGTVKDSDRPEIDPKGSGQTSSKTVGPKRKRRQTTAEGDSSPSSHSPPLPEDLASSLNFSSPPTSISGSVSGKSLTKRSFSSQNLLAVFSGKSDSKHKHWASPTSSVNLRKDRSSASVAVPGSPYVLAGGPPPESVQPPQANARDSSALEAIDDAPPSDVRTQSANPTGSSHRWPLFKRAGPGGRGSAKADGQRSRALSISEPVLISRNNVPVPALPTRPLHARSASQARIVAIPLDAFSAEKSPTRELAPSRSTLRIRVQVETLTAAEGDSPIKSRHSPMECAERVPSPRNAPMLNDRHHESETPVTSSTIKRNASLRRFKRSASRPDLAHASSPDTSSKEAKFLELLSKSDQSENGVIKVSLTSSAARKAGVR